MELLIFQVTPLLMVQFDLQDKRATAIHVTAVSFTVLGVLKKVEKGLLHNTVLGELEEVV